MEEKKINFLGKEFSSKQLVLGLAVLIIAGLIVKKLKDKKDHAIEDHDTDIEDKPKKRKLNKSTEE